MIPGDLDHFSGVLGKDMFDRLIGRPPDDYTSHVEVLSSQKGKKRLL